MQKDHEEAVIQASLFGKLQIFNGENTVTGEKIKSDMLTKLLAYILLHCRKEMNNQELIDALWPETDIMEGNINPGGALKNLVYRLRNMLKVNLGNCNYITTGHGNYSWNPKVPLKLDVEIFDRLLEEAVACGADDTERRIDLLTQAAALYKGDILSKRFSDYWILTIEAYYHSKYLNAVNQLATLLYAQNRFEELEKLCNAAITIDNTDEKIHVWMIRSYIGQKKQQLAFQCYKETAKMLYEQLGIRNSEYLEELFREIMAMSNDKAEEAELIEIHTKLIETEIEEGKKMAYYCEFPIFKEIYSWETRRCIRNQISEYVLLLTLYNGKKDWNANQKQEIMERFKAILLRQLRMSDVVSQYSANQFVVLLPNCSYENGSRVAERIIKGFYAVRDNRRFQIKYDLDEISGEQSFYFPKKHDELL